MMRVRLLSEPELCQMGQKCADYCPSQYFDLLREKGDFNDPDSLLLLKTLHGDEAVEGKWYRRENRAGEPCLPAISPEAMYGLVVLENSRKGIYTIIPEEFTEDETEYRMERAAGRNRTWPLVWDAFAAMEREVLLAFRRKNFSFGGDIPLDNEFLLENYPVDGVPSEVWVENRRFGKKETVDGVFHVGNCFYDLRYCWREDPEELIRVIDGEQSFIPLPLGELSEREFLNLCSRRNACEDYWDPDREELSPRRIINHARFCPEDADARRLLYLIVEKHGDGTYRLREETSVKYPTYVEMYEAAAGMGVPGGETFVLPVDVEERMNRALDIQKTLAAFRVAGNVIETFGPKEGLMEFQTLLRKAVEAGAFAEKFDFKEEL